MIKKCNLNYIQCRCPKRRDRILCGEWLINSVLMKCSLQTIPKTNTPQYEIRFQRQKAIGDFIADFYCHKAKLVIEIDGSQHYSEESILKDEFRTEILGNYGLKVIRFTNRQINTSFKAVCEYIDFVVKASIFEGGGPR